MIFPRCYQIHDEYCLIDEYCPHFSFRSKNRKHITKGYIHILTIFLIIFEAPDIFQKIYILIQGLRLKLFDF